MIDGTCPFCDSKSFLTEHGQSFTKDYNCPECGPFTITFEAEEYLNEHGSKTNKRCISGHVKKNPKIYIDRNKLIELFELCS
jgi:hypothetical protein